MSQKIRLTWIMEKGAAPIVEDCLLLHEDEDIFVDGVLQEGMMEKLMKDGRVLFEDSAGVFGLKPKQVIKIEKL